MSWEEAHLRMKRRDGIAVLGIQPHIQHDCREGRLQKSCTKQQHFKYFKRNIENSMLFQEVYTENFTNIK
jgi:hypothetical protein